MVLLFYHLQRFFGVELNRDDDPKILHAAMDRCVNFKVVFFCPPQINLERVLCLLLK